MLMFKTLLWLAAVSSIYCYTTVSSGSCIKVPIIPTFNTQSYSGVWYEIQRFTPLFEIGLQCVTATYGYVNSSQVTVTNYGKNLQTGVVSLINGIGRITNTSQPSYITVSLPIQVFTYIIKQSTGSYMVIDSDYKTYSLVYSCSQVTKRLKTETVWILSRGKTLNSMVINYLYAELISLGINPSHFETVTQTCNN